MKKILVILLLIFANDSFAGWAYSPYQADEGFCYETKEIACSSAVGQPRISSNPTDIITFSSFAESNAKCTVRFNGATAGGHISNSYAECVIEPPPPTCTIEVGTNATRQLPLPLGWEYAGEENCYAYCQYVAYVDQLENDESNVQCTYTGDPAHEYEPGEFTNVPDPATDPNYCHVKGKYENECLDWDHPFNDPEDPEEEGCNGKQFGRVDFGLGEVGVCVPQGGGGDGLNYGAIDTSEDLDGDGKLNKDDNDIDGDGIPNESDDDKDGDGIKNTDDSNPDGNQGSGEGEDGTDANSETSKGSATTCAKKPTSTGDAQLAAIHQQLWLNECKGTNESKAITDKLDEIKDEFEKLTEDVESADADQVGADLQSEAIGEMDSILDDYITDIDASSGSGGPMDGVASGSGIDDVLTSFLPSAAACSPLQLTFLSKFSLPIPCEKFSIFKEWFGWALSYYTIYSIIMLALAPVPSKV